MKIGYYVEGKADEAFVLGLRDKYCPKAELAEGIFRGSSTESHHREIRKALLDLWSSHRCDFLVVLTDADESRWRDIFDRGWKKVPAELEHRTLFGVADRNIECWLALDRDALSKELGCKPNDFPSDNPSGFIKKRFGVSSRGSTGVDRIRRFVAKSIFHNWLHDKSFDHFWEQIWVLSKREGCDIPNERERP